MSSDALSGAPSGGLPGGLPGGSPLRVAVLGATGATGRQLVAQALDRGHAVVALARDPGRVDTSGTGRLRAVAVDVHDPGSVLRALAGVDVVVSGLGVVSGGRPGTLAAGAEALRAARLADPDLRVVWLGAFGVGRTARAAGPLTRLVLGIVLRAELADKVAADETVLGFGGTVVAAGPLTNGPLSLTRRSLPLTGVPRRLVVRPVSRATVAAAMLDEAAADPSVGGIRVPLT